MSKVTAKDFVVESDEEEKLEEEGFMVKSDHEAVAYYSNNKVKKFFKKPFNPKNKNNNEFKGNNLNAKSVKVDSNRKRNK